MEGLKGPRGALGRLVASPDDRIALQAIGMTLDATHRSSADERPWPRLRWGVQRDVG